MKKIIFICISIIVSLISVTEMTFAGSFTPSRYSTSSSQITFTNNSASVSMAIYWVDLDGNERYYTTLQPRGSYTQDTYIGHIWNVRDTNNWNLLATITSNSTYQQNTISPPSSTTSPYYTTSASKIYFLNSSNVSVSVNWIDQSGYEKYYRSLTPGESYTQDTSIDHVWVLRHATIGTELGRTVSTNTYQTYTVTQRFSEPYYNNSTANKTYFPNSYPTNQGSYYNNNTWTYNTTQNQGYYYNNNSYYNNYSNNTNQVCDLYDGAYNNSGFSAALNGGNSVRVDSFRKKGSKVSFSTYDTAPDGRLRTLRWVLNCNNGSITQR